MQRIAIQLKKRLNTVDFRKIKKGFLKTRFLLLYENTLYGIDQLFMIKDNERGKDYVIRNGEYYAVSEILAVKVDYDSLLIDIINKMYTINKVIKSSNSSLMNNNTDNSVNDKIVDLLLYNKDSNFYSSLYEDNLTLSLIINGNTKYLDLFKRNESTKSKNSFWKKLYSLERILGESYYIDLKATSVVSNKQYLNKLKILTNALEDPLKVFDIFKYLEYFGAALLLIDDIKTTTNKTLDILTLPKSLINFTSIYDDYIKRANNILNYKLTRARKVKISGRLVSIEYKYSITGSTYYYLPKKIEYISDEIVKQRKGDFLLKITSTKDIVEAYECSPLSEVLL